MWPGSAEITRGMQHLHSALVEGMGFSGGLGGKESACSAGDLALISG